MTRENYFKFVEPQGLALMRDEMISIMQHGANDNNNGADTTRRSGFET